jgi:DNA-binding NtrC family response regulator
MVDRQQRAESSRIGAVRSNPLKGVRILLVEDELLFGWGLQTALYDAGCNAVRLVSTTGDAFKELALWQPDGAILDMRLRDGNLSLPVADLLADRAVAFLFVSGHPRDTVTARHRHRTFIEKPCTVDTVVEALARTLSEAPPSA